MQPDNQETICAVATAPGRGGVGIVRVSGPLAYSIAEQTTHTVLKPRHATFCDFIDSEHRSLDQGIALYFPNPHSFTGEDVFEFQGHGGPILLDLMIERCIELGARMARPGEFSERAFLNDKIDLTQAEAIADLINANSKLAAQQALNSLKGAFAEEINQLSHHLTELRIYVESAIDFPEEEVDFLSDGAVESRLNALKEKLKIVINKAQQGTVIQEGMKVVLAGKPNAGKSTLLNALAEKDAAIVTDIAGTTRDIISEHIFIDGMPLHVFDTAGLRDADNEVERIGVERARSAIQEADRVLLLIDARENESDFSEQWPELFTNPDIFEKITIVRNKCDLVDRGAAPINGQVNAVAISAKTGQGLDELKTHLLKVMGLEQLTEGNFSARRRHLDALTKTEHYLDAAAIQIKEFQAGELAAEDLRLAHDALGEITGKISADDLLGKIFSSFCIGK
jgi:tRNA modification GTPase